MGASQRPAAPPTRPPARASTRDAASDAPPPSSAPRHRPRPRPVRPVLPDGPPLVARHADRRAVRRARARLPRIGGKRGERRGAPLLVQLRERGDGMWEACAGERGLEGHSRGKEPPPMRRTPASWRSWDLFEGFWRRAVEIIWHRDRSAWGRPWGRLPGVELGVPKEAHPRPASLVPTRVLVSRGNYAATSHEGSCPGMRQLCQVRLGTFSQ